MFIPGDAYGTHTDALRAIVTRAEATLLFDAKALQIDEQRVAHQLRAHNAVIVARHGKRLTPIAVEFLRGPVALLMAHWSNGAGWRSELEAAVAEMHRSYSRPPLSDRLRPPIWPLAGTMNVFGATLVATEQTYRRCQHSSNTPAEMETGWAAACFIESIVDDALVSELFSDLEPSHALAPLLTVCTSNVIPIGWKPSAPGTFQLYIYDTSAR